MCVCVCFEEGEGVLWPKKGVISPKRELFFAKKNSYRQTPEFLPPTVGFFVPNSGKVAVKQTRRAFFRQNLGPAKGQNWSES